MPINGGPGAVVLVSRAPLTVSEAPEGFQPLPSSARGRERKQGRRMGSSHVDKGKFTASPHAQHNDGSSSGRQVNLVSLAYVTEEKNNKVNLRSSMLICCKLYISEAQNGAALDGIEWAGRADPEAAIVNKFEDTAYNRVRYTLVSYIVHDGATGVTYSPLRQALFSMVEAALSAINLETHLGAHPRIGAVDHICFYPLTRASPEDAAQLAKLTAADMGNGLQVPVFFCEAALPNNRALDAIRRELGYYRPDFMGSQWSGWTLPQVLAEKPDEGPSEVSPAKGITVIGASPWVETYNVPVKSTGVSAARRIARLVSARGCGLPTARTLGLVHWDDAMEIACMLLDPSRVGPDRMHNRVEMLAAEEGLEVEKGYFTDFSQDMIIERYMKLVSTD